MIVFPCRWNTLNQSEKMTNTVVSGLLLIARYETIKTALKVDVTTGDVITPDAVRYTYPSAFEDKYIEVWAYNLETILAEKLETILRRSVLNTTQRFL